MAAPIEERYVEVDGIRIFLRERRGDGIPTIWVHGNPTDSQDWLPFIAATWGSCCFTADSNALNFDVGSPLAPISTWAKPGPSSRTWTLMVSASNRTVTKTSEAAKSTAFSTNEVMACSTSGIRQM